MIPDSGSVSYFARNSDYSSTKFSLYRFMELWLREPINSKFLKQNYSKSREFIQSLTHRL